MQDTPPRRTRRKPTGGGGTPLPLVPILIGVIVLGFVIGAGLSFFGKGQPAIVSVSDSPSAAATFAPPSALPETPPPLPSPSLRPGSPEPRPSPLQLQTEHPAVAQSATRRPSPSVAGAAPATATATAAAVANSATEAAAAATAASDASTAATETTPVPGRAPRSTDATDAVRAAPVPPGAQNAAPAPAAAASAASQQSPVVVSGSTTPFARLAASVVRVYLSAVARGDYDSAAAELAAPPAGALVEQGVVDGATQVRAVEVHGTGDIVTVNVDLKTSAGPYSAQFTVQKSPTGAALIADHSITKS